MHALRKILFPALALLFILGCFPAGAWAAANKFSLDISGPEPKLLWKKPDGSLKDFSSIGVESVGKNKDLYWVAVNKNIPGMEKARPGLYFFDGEGKRLGIADYDFGDSSGVDGVVFNAGRTFFFVPQHGLVHTSFDVYDYPGLRHRGKYGSVSDIIWVDERRLVFTEPEDEKPRPRGADVVDGEENGGWSSVVVLALSVSGENLEFIKQATETENYSLEAVDFNKKELSILETSVKEWKDWADNKKVTARKISSGWFPDGARADADKFSLELSGPEPRLLWKKPDGSLKDLGSFGVESIDETKDLYWVAINKNILGMDEARPGLYFFDAKGRRLGIADYDFGGGSGVDGIVFNTGRTFFFVPQHGLVYTSFDVYDYPGLRHRGGYTAYDDLAWFDERRIIFTDAGEESKPRHEDFIDGEEHDGLSSVVVLTLSGSAENLVFVKQATKTTDYYLEAVDHEKKELTIWESSVAEWKDWADLDSLTTRSIVVPFP